jgi:hypothetical protein
MYHGLTNDFLYSAHKLSVIFGDESGNDKNEVVREGTGFFVGDKNNRNKFFLITNRHVLDINYKSESLKYKDFKVKFIIVQGRSHDDCPFLNGYGPFNIKFSETYENDVACIVNPLPITSAKFPYVPISYWLPINFLATKDQLAEKLSICDFLAFPGYPKWHDQLEGRPILRTGTISSDPRHNYSFAKEFRGECIAYEAFSSGGSSGSPVFALEKGPKPGDALVFSGYRELLLIGINAGHITDGKDHSGISYFYKSSVILDIIGS